MQSILVLFIPLALYLLVVRPQRQRVRSQRALLGDLGPGDVVVTAGGMIGTLVAMGPDRASVELSPGVVVDMLPPAIVRRFTPAPTADDPAGHRPLPEEP